jgi:class 3 adenylate cyclase
VNGYIKVMNDTSTIYSTRRHISSLKKHVTILFTDIVNSTQYWDRFGDVQGRLMVDHHNRLLFPIISKFRGKIIKTIGDSIMAVFAKPEHALKAAIAIQQTMAAERQRDDTFRIHIRIGIHTGDAIVEKEDVYGDIVNVAARVEKKGRGNEILVSQTTVAYIDDEYAFIFKQKGCFVPKGKNKKFTIYTCDWKNHPLLIDKEVKTSSVPVSRRQKLELGFFSIVIFGVLYFIYLKYLRYLVSDSEKVALLYLNITNILQNYPYISGGTVLFVFVLFLLLIRMHTLPLIIMRVIKGGFIFSIGFMMTYLLVHYLPLNLEDKWDEVLDSSYHLYVEVLENNSTVFTEPSLNGEEIVQMQAGQLLLQTDYKEVGNLVWNKVLLGVEKYGWIIRVSPPQMGIPAKRVSQAYKFYFRYKDLYAFIFAFVCFFIGFWRFRIRPI